MYSPIHSEDRKHWILFDPSWEYFPTISVNLEKNIYFLAGFEHVEKTSQNIPIF